MLQAPIISDSFNTLGEKVVKGSCKHERKGLKQGFPAQVAVFLAQGGARPLGVVVVHQAQCTV